MERAHRLTSGNLSHPLTIWTSPLWIAAALIAAQTLTWGGDHVRMDLTPTGATLEFDCAHGTITESVPSTDGAFSLNGTFTPERSGPSRGDGPPTVNATYSGSISGDTMTLRIALEGSSTAAASYELRRGSPGNLRKCR